MSSNRFAPAGRVGKIPTVLLGLGVVLALAPAAATVYLESLNDGAWTRLRSVAVSRDGSSPKATKRSRQTPSASGDRDLAGVEIEAPTDGI